MSCYIFITKVLGFSAFFETHNTFREQEKKKVLAMLACQKANRQEKKCPTTRPLVPKAYSRTAPPRLQNNSCTRSPSFSTKRSTAWVRSVSSYLIRTCLGISIYRCPGRILARCTVPVGRILPCNTGITVAILYFVMNTQKLLILRA